MASQRFAVAFMDSVAKRLQTSSGTWKLLGNQCKKYASLTPGSAEHSPFKGHWQVPRQEGCYTTLTAESRLVASSQPVSIRTLPWSARWQSGTPDNHGFQKKLSSLVLNGTQLTKSRSAGASAKLYKQLPSKVQKLMTDASKPGSLQKAFKLQLEAFWGNNSGKVLALGGAVVVYLLWRSLFAFASMFFKLSETMADFGFLALAAALASFGFLYLRRWYVISPDSVYRLAMLQLNTNPAVLEIMGAPVAGSNVRASVLTGGGLRLKGLQPRLRSRRVQMIFPLTGSERRGLVSLEAKKLKGRYLFKLLAVDVPTAAGPEQRLFVEGDDVAYARGGVISELRDPFLQAISLKDANEMEDEIDDAAADADAEQARRAKQAAKLQKQPKPMAEGGGMYSHERAFWSMRNAFSQWFPSKPASVVEAPLAAKSTPVPSDPSRAIARATPVPGSPLGTANKSDSIPSPASEKSNSAKAGDLLNPGIIPEEPIGEEADKLHQLKKEASSQQAP